MADKLDQGTLSQLQAGFRAAPAGWHDTPNGGEGYPIPALQVQGATFWPILPNGVQDMSGYPQPIGWTKNVGHYEYDHFDLLGNFTYHSSGDPSIGQLLTAAAVVGGGMAFGYAMGGSAAFGGAASVAGDAFMPGALGAGGTSAFAAGEASALTASLAPWEVATIGAGAGLGSSTAATAATASPSGISSAGLAKGAAAFLPTLAGGKTTANSLSPGFASQQPQQMGVNSLLSGDMLPILLILGALALGT